MENLSGVISRLVLKAELLEELERQINQTNGFVLTIEDLIVLSEDHFNLSDEVFSHA